MRYHIIDATSNADYQTMQPERIRESLALECMTLRLAQVEQAAEVLGMPASQLLADTISLHMSLPAGERRALHISHAQGYIRRYARQYSTSRG